MEERQVTGEYIIEVYVRVNPRIVEVYQRFALRFVVDDRRVHNILVLVHALEVAAAEQVDAHDAEDEPEDEAHNQYVEDGGNRLDECVHNHLSIKRTALNQTHGCQSNYGYFSGVINVPIDISAHAQ